MQSSVGELMMGSAAQHCTSPSPLQASQMQLEPQHVFNEVEDPLPVTAPAAKRPGRLFSPLPAAAAPEEALRVDFGQRNLARLGGDGVASVFGGSGGATGR